MIQNIISTVNGNILTSGLATNQTSLTFTDSSITTSSIIDIYSSVYTVIPTNATLSNGTLTLTFSSSHVACSVKVVIK